MPVDDLLLNSDGDYELVDGEFAKTRSPASAIRHQLEDVLGAWVGDQGTGRDRRNASERFNTEDDAREEASSILAALSLIEDEGLIDDIEVTVSRDDTGRWFVIYACRDVESGASIDFDEHQTFGV